MRVFKFMYKVSIAFGIFCFSYVCADGRSRTNELLRVFGTTFYLGTKLCDFDRKFDSEFVRGLGHKYSFGSTYGGVI